MRIVCKKGDNINEILQCVEKYIKDESAKYLLIDTDMQIEINVISNFKDLSLKKCASERSEILKIKEYIQLHYSENIDLKLIAGMVNFTPSHLSSLFKKETGINFSDYLTKIRMSVAKELLDSQDLLVYEVAEKTGYSNSGYFGKTFKKYWGISPEKFKRKQHKRFVS